MDQKERFYHRIHYVNSHMAGRDCREFSCHMPFNFPRWNFNFINTDFLELKLTYSIMRKIFLEKLMVIQLDNRFKSCMEPSKVIR